MEGENLLKRFREKYGYILGGIVALLGLVLTIYSIIHVKKPQIMLEIINEADILDVHKPLKDLSISFQGQDIQESNLNLRIFSIRLINTGDVDILSNFYDPEDVWGIEIESGKIVEVRLVDSNSDYLRSKLTPELLAPATVKFKKLIFEKDKYFTIDLLVLHSKGQPPDVRVIGKIAGIDAITPIRTWQEKQKKSFWKQLIEGSILVHAARFFFYLFALLALGLAIALPGEALSRLRRWRRKRLVRKHIEPLLLSRPLEEGTKRKLLFDWYTKEPIVVEGIVEALSKDEPKIIRQLKTYKLTKQINQLKADALKTVYQDENWIELSVDERNERFIGMRFTSPLITELVDKGALRLTEDEQLYIDPDFKQALEELRGTLQKSNRS